VVVHTWSFSARYPSYEVIGCHLRAGFEKEGR